MGQDKELLQIRETLITAIARMGYPEEFGAAIAEAGRETEEKLELSEDMIDMINARLAVIGQHINEEPSVSVTYFLPDKKKPGGQYVTVSGNVKRLDGIKCAIIMADGKTIPMEDVRYLDGDLFRGYE